MSVSDVAFSGDLRLIPLFDLGQLLRLNGATGCLNVQHGERKGTLYFDRGDLVNAVDDSLVEGEEAAITLFGWRAGTFEFQAEAHTATRVITSGAESIMMEAARRLDEAAAGADDAPAERETRRLQERQSAMDALRDVFGRITGETPRPLTGVDALATTIQLYELTRPEDRLVYRAGEPPRVRRRGRWARVPQPPLGPQDYDELRTRLFDACDPTGDADAIPPAGRRMTLGDGRSLALERIADAEGESLWLKPVGPHRLAPAALTGDLAGLLALLGLPEAIVLVGAADLVTARRLLESVACLATGPADTLVAVSRDGACRPDPEHGLALLLTPGELVPTLAAVEPEIVALDPGLRGRDLSLEELASVPRVFAGMVGHNPAAFPARWSCRMAPQESSPASAWLVSTLAGIVTARPDPQHPDTLAVSTWVLDAGEREGALRGDTAPLGDPPASPDH